MPNPAAPAGPAALAGPAIPAAPAALRLSPFGAAVKALDEGDQQALEVALRDAPTRAECAAALRLGPSEPEGPVVFYRLWHPALRSRPVHGFRPIASRVKRAGAPRRAQTVGPYRLWEQVLCFHPACPLCHPASPKELPQGADWVQALRRKVKLLALVLGLVPAEQLERLRVRHEVWTPAAPLGRFDAAVRMLRDGDAQGLESALAEGALHANFASAVGLDPSGPEGPVVRYRPWHPAFRSRPAGEVRPAGADLSAAADADQAVALLGQVRLLVLALGLVSPEEMVTLEVRPEAWTPEDIARQVEAKAVEAAQLDARLHALGRAPRRSSVLRQPLSAYTRGSPEWLETLRGRARSMPQMSTLEAFSRWSFADLERSRRNTESELAKQAARIEKELGAAMEDWSNCLTVKLAALRGRQLRLARKQPDGLRDRAAEQDAQALDIHDLVSARLDRMLRAAKQRPNDRFVVAHGRTAIWSGKGFALLAEQILAAQSKKAAKRRELRESSGIAAPLDVPTPRPAGFLARWSPLWIGELPGGWRVQAELLSAVRAIAPFWLARQGPKGEIADPTPGLRTLAAAQGLPHTAPQTQRDEGWTSVPSAPNGVPIADLDDPWLAREAFKGLSRDDKLAADRGRIRAVNVLNKAFESARPDTQEAWRAVVALERQLAGRPTSVAGSDAVAEAAWVRFFGDKASRKEASDAFSGVCQARQIDELLRHLVGGPGASARDGAPQNAQARNASLSPERNTAIWSCAELGGLLAWCSAWCDGYAVGRGLRYRTPRALEAALGTALDAVRSGSAQGDVWRPVLAMCGFAFRFLRQQRRLRPGAADAQVVQRLDVLLGVAAQHVEQLGGPDAAWELLTAPSDEMAHPDEPAHPDVFPGDRLVSAVLDADELLAASAWLGGGAPSAQQQDEVVASLLSETYNADAAARARARRALELCRAHFPVLPQEAGALALLELLRSPVADVLCAPLSLGRPVLIDVDSTAFAAEGDEPMRRFGSEGLAARVWLGAGSIELSGPGWSVPGRHLRGVAVGAPSEAWTARLTQGAWPIFHDGALVSVLHIRATTL